MRGVKSSKERLASAFLASRPVRWCGDSLRGLALASVIANIGIIVTGAAVRLTKSGLGCPTWPRCTDESYVSTPEMGVNGAIELATGCSRSCSWRSRWPASSARWPAVAAH
jgi:cytochrome c oxidase assembly protein subunit 15